MNDVEMRARVDALLKPLAPARTALLQRAVDAKSLPAKIHWLREAVRLPTEALAGLSPCRSGCAHCCHISLTLSRPEAEQIAREIGRKLATPPPERVAVLGRQDGDNSARAIERRANYQRQAEWLKKAYVGIPCTFLVEERCSIYTHRPMECRTHLSLERDSEPCRIGGEFTKALYFDDANENNAAVMALTGEEAVLADVRDWFPASPRVAARTKE